MSRLTPFQPVGPYFHVMLRDAPAGVDTLVTEATRGERITIAGTVLDGAGRPMSDALIEIWQADANGHYRHPADPGCANADAAFSGFGRTATDAQGGFRFETVKPGVVAGPHGAPQAPHILVSLLAPGVLTRYWTRLYFDDERGNGDDAILRLVAPERRATLIARRDDGSTYRFDIVVQGPAETVFFEA